MNGWTKYFIDGTTEVGSDEDVRDKKASWRSGRLSDMNACKLVHSDANIVLKGTGEFWQSDDMEVGFLESIPTYVVRRIEKLIEDKDKAVMIRILSEKSLEVEFLDHVAAGSYALINHTGQWLVAELDLQEFRGRVFFSEGKI